MNERLATVMWRAFLMENKEKLSKYKNDISVKTMSNYLRRKRYEI
jgi:hypothetical protein